MEWLHDQIGVPFAAHLGKWSSTTPYANQSDFSFIVENQNGLALPQSVEFWDYLMKNASKWGLSVVKQDHMNEQMLDMDITLTNVNTIKDWILQQGEGCTRHQISIMYCMDFPNIFLNSLQVGSNAILSRASNDYVPDDANKNWKIGVTSALLWSIGLYPYKDTFYSNTNEMVIKSDAKFYNFTEPYPITHAVVSVLSSGPVASSDGLGFANTSLIMKVCRLDGLILKPDRPAVTIDRTWIQRSFGDSDNSRAEIGPKGEVWTTYTDIGYNRWNYIIGVNLLSDFYALPSDLLKEGNYNNNNNLDYVAYVYDKHSLGKSVSSVQLFNADNPLLISKGNNYGDFNYWVICPMLQNSNSPILLGELDKITPVSRNRFQSIDITGNDMILVITGVPNEMVSFSILHSISNLTNINQFTCTVPSSGLVKFQYSTQQCSPM